jgi:hypothetical protein
MSYHELKMPYALYNRRRFHAICWPTDWPPQTVRRGVGDASQVLNPFAAGTADDPVWRFTPFHETNPQNDLEQLFLSLKPNTPDTRVDEWRVHLPATSSLAAAPSPT